MMRLLRAVLAGLRKLGRRHPRAGGTSRLGWKGTPVVEGCQKPSARGPLSTLTVPQLGRAAPDTRPGHSE
jgi:hypothetical protein